MVTIADKIRSMSNEELEKLLRQSGAVCTIDREWCESRPECKNCTKTWLQRPAGEWEI